MQGSDIRELWARIIALETKVAALEIEDDNYEILGTFAVPSSDGGTEGNARDVECDLPSIEELDINDYGETD